MDWRPWYSSSGIVIDAGKFDWTDSKFQTFNKPDMGYHGLRYAHDLGDLSPLAFVLRMRLVQMRNLGACMSPDNAWIFCRVLKLWLCGWNVIHKMQLGQRIFLVQLPLCMGTLSGFGER